MSSNSNAGSFSSTSNTSSTLRPRATRLISYLEEDSDSAGVVGGAKATSTSNVQYTSSSSALGALPSTRRAERRTRQTESVNTGDETPRRTSGANGLWDSWTQIQGMASTFLGSDASITDTNTTGKSKSAFKTPGWMKQDRSYGPVNPVEKWGPRVPDPVGIGSGLIEERQAMVQAKKREALLLAATSAGKDFSGRFKRKGSDASLPVDSPTRSDDVLVYRHKVLPNDTMAGVTIKYSCQQEIFRKVNRLWPNDRIQIRNFVLLPVDACAVRGRKVDGPDEVDLLDEDPPRVQNQTDAATKIVNGYDDKSKYSAVNEESTTNSSIVGEQDEGYTHDSWVSLPNFSRAIEILRIPRTTLGYFPPARRKSNQHLRTSGIESAVSSPRTSFDTLRHPPSHAAQQAQLQQQTLRSTSAESSLSHVPRLSHSSSATSRHRSHSTATTSSQTTNLASNTFFSALRGPGGVGSLRGMRTESSRPGPAEDPLNQNFAKYLPSLAMTLDAAEGEYINQEYPIPPVRGFVTSQNLSLPRASMESLRSSRSGRSNSSTSAFGAGVENWVKKIASATTGTTRPGLGRTNSDRTIGPGGKSTATGIGIGIGGETGLGDLIELETNPDARNFLSDSNTQKSLHNEEEDGLETPKIGTTSKMKSSSSSIQRLYPDQEDQLNERFPIRGKVTKAYGSKK